MLANDPLDRVLIIDLTKRRATVERRPDLFASALGGVGVATRLLAEECPGRRGPTRPGESDHIGGGPALRSVPDGEQNGRDVQVAA